MIQLQAHPVRKISAAVGIATGLLAVPEKTIKKARQNLKLQPRRLQKASGKQDHH